MDKTVFFPVWLNKVEFDFLMHALSGFCGMYPSDSYTYCMGQNLKDRLERKFKTLEEELK